MELVVLNHPRVNPRRPKYQYAKRFVDFVLCILALPVLIPVFLVCSLAIYLDSGRPIFFIQDRIGKGGQRIKIFKFRTMKTNLNDSSGRSFQRAYVRGEIIQNMEGNRTFKPVTDDQVIRIGRFLRRTSLDELPQLINVLKGEMSIVGPRPNVLWEVEEYRPWHYERLEVLPGITGLAQVRGRSNINFNSLVRYDIHYIEKQSLILDLRIIWWTFKSAILSEGAE